MADSNMNSFTGNFFTVDGRDASPLFPATSMFDGEEVDYFRQTGNFETSPSLSDDFGYIDDILQHRQIEVNIKSAFSLVFGKPSYNGLLQFWSPQQIRSKHVLITRDQPFIVQSGHEKHKVYLEKHRSSSQEYQYNIAADKFQFEGEPTIISGSPAHAFRSKLAEVVPNLRVQEGSPLVDSALECELMSYFVLPISASSESQSKCVGVVECCTREFGCLLDIFCYLVNALKTVGLSTFHTEGMLCKTNKDGLICATDHDLVAIEAALKEACISHELTLAQVSIAYNEDFNDTPLEGKHMNQMRVCKMIGRCPDSDEYDFMDYCATCDMLPLNLGEGLAGKEPENYKPHFCRNIYEMNNNELSDLIEPIIKKHSCLVICLRSKEKDVDYVFEFLWLQNRKYTVLIQALLITLKKCLPNFKFASDGELGVEVSVVQVGNSSKAKGGSFKIFQGVKLTPIPEMFEREQGHVAEQCIESLQLGKGNTSQPVSLSAEAIRQQYGNTHKIAAENLGVSESTLKRVREEFGLGDWQGPNGKKKRKIKRLYKVQSDMINEEDDRQILGSVPVNGDTVTIKVYTSDEVTIILRVPRLQAKFKDVQKKICNRLNLKPGSFKLKYVDEDGEGILLVSDECMRNCIESSISEKGIKIKLFVWYV